jgi:hypothetical protein
LSENLDAQVPPWHPSFIEKPGDFIRLSASAIGIKDSVVCLDNFALKARPSTKVTSSFTLSASEDYNSFPLGLIKDAFVAGFNANGLNLDQQEPAEFLAPYLSQVIKQSRSEVHPATIKWLADATNGFAKAWDDAANEDGELVFSQIIDPLYFSKAAVPVEWFAWGIFLANEDFSVRELRMLKIHSAGKSQLDENRLNAILKILLSGEANSGMDFRSATQKIEGIWPKPDRIRVREIGVLDGSQKLIYDQSSAAIEIADQELNLLINKRLAGGEQRVSTDCLKCKANSVCPALPTNPGLLGVLNRSDRIKSFSPSKLNSYQRCNHAYFLQHELALHSVPKLTSTAQNRGLLVHQWIERAHKRNSKCTKADLPTNSNIGSIANELNWTTSQAELVIEYLSQHLNTCPLKTSSQVQHEVDMWVMDSDASVLVGTRPDMIYTTKETLIWREIKSTDKELDLTLDSFMDMFSQIPLAIVLMSRTKNLPNISKDWSKLPNRRVELEIITKQQSRVVQFDLNDTAITTAAWQKLAQQTDSWITDKHFTPPANPPCQWCAVSQWCEFADTDKRIVELVGVKVDLATGEIVEGPNDQLDQSQQVARALGLIDSLNESAETDEAVPF